MARRNVYACIGFVLAMAIATRTEFVQSEDRLADQAARVDIAKIAATFYRDLRNEERSEALKILTDKAQKLIRDGASLLADLPRPDSGSRAIRVGRAAIEGEVAEVSVQVRADRRTHKTKLHLRREGDQWRVFAISAAYPDGEKSIDFEADAEPAEAGDTLESLVGKPFDLEGYTPGGTPLDMAQYKGKVVLIDFWATWCGPCRAEIPNILESFREHHQEGFDVIAVSLDRDLDALARFLAEEKPPWTVVADAHPQNRNSMGAKYGIRGIPSFVLVGRDGRVAAVNCRGPSLGPVVAEALRRGI
jgi:thiol-disulfide isomerase/thioredoxin